MSVQTFATRPTPALSGRASRAREEAPIPAGYQTLDDVIREFEVDSDFRERMKESRAWAADVLYRGKPPTLRVIRMKKGLSQAQLAAAIGTQQPQIARLESGAANPQLDTCRKIAAVLGIDLNILDLALQQQATHS